DIAERPANRPGAILSDAEVDRRRKLGLQSGKERPDSIGYHDRVGAWLPHHLECDRTLHGVFAVDPRALGHRLYAVDDVGDLFETDRAAIAIRNDHRPKH